MHTITKTVYNFDELTGKAKEKARSWLSDAATSFEWYDSTFEYWQEKLEKVGVTDAKIYFRGFWSQGDGACFEGSIDIADYLKAKKLAGKYRALYRFIKECGLPAGVKHEGHYSHENCTRFYREDCYAVDGYDWQRAQSQLEDVWQGLIDDMKGYMREIYRDLEKEYWYLVDEKQLQEFAEANEYTFDEYGNREG